MKIKSSLIVVFLAIVLMACSEDSVAPNQTQVDLEFNTVTSSTSGTSNARMAASGLSFSSGFITLSEVEFETETDNDSVEVEFNLEQNTKIDFATGETNPDISGVTFPKGTYNEMEVEIELQDEGDEPAVVLNGTFTDADGVDHDVRFEFNSGETFEVEKEGTITFEGGESVLAQVTLDPTAWFAGVSDEQLAAATKNNDGVIVVNSTQNPDIFDIVADGLDLATEVEISN